jgi:hypothetical protein
MSPVWRWILAMGGSAFVLIAGVIVVFRGGPDYGAYGWLIVVIGAISLLVNLVMRKQFL